MGFLNNNQVQDQGQEYFPYQTIPTQAPSEKADLMDKIRPDLIVETMRHRLMGEELVDGKWTALPQLKDFSLSFRGAWDISNLMLSASSSNVSISKINDKDVRERAKSIIDTAMIMCIRNWQAYGIHGSDQVAFVKEIVLTNTFVTLKQPDQGSIQNLIKGTTHEQRMVQNTEKKPGWVSGMLRSN